MALTATGNPFGESQAGYIRLDRYIGNRDGTWTATAYCYASKAAADAKAAPMGQFQVEIPWTVANPLALLENELRRKVRALEVPGWKDAGAADAQD